jgi:threonine dehydrogenase-like Zn-dependent dehydrogenase
MREWRTDNGERMKALVLDNGVISLKEVEDPLPASGEALIKVIKAGICNTDLEIEKGYMPFSGILGHEFVGRVEEAPEESWIGQRVVGEINLYCETCPFCIRGETKHCSSRQVLGIVEKNGAFAEYLTLPVKNLHILPDNVSEQEGVFAEPLAAALDVLEQVEIARDNRVLVLGDGKIGLLIALVLSLDCDSVVCVGKHERNLTILAQLGIRTHLLGEVLEPDFPLVVEATGNEEGLETALQMVEPKGTVVLKSTYRGEACLNVSEIVVDELRLIGSRCGPFPKALELLKDKRINVADVLDGDFPLEHAAQAFELAGKPGTLKVLLSP